jgi:arylsulfatase A-like enzyme
MRLLPLLFWFTVACGADPAELPESARPAVAGQLPDVLLVSLDTLRADRLSCYGYGRATSPEIDALAAAGVRFAEAHAPSSNTKPSHMSLFTGLDPLAHDVRPVRLRATVRPALAATVPTLPELLRRAGYQTASFTDRGGLPPSAGFARGFDHLRAEWEELPKKIAAVGKYLRSAARRDRPLFLFFHTYETHAPYLPPEPFHGRYTDPDYDGEFRRRHDELAGSPMAEFWREKGKFLKPWPGMSDDDVRFASDLYDEEIAWTDQQIGRLWRLWTRERGEGNTFLVLFSDHGEEFFEHEGLGHQRSLYGELVRVPLVLLGPDLPAGRVVDAPVSLTGVLPTVLAYLDLPSVDAQARSFLDLARGAATPMEPVYSQMGNRGAELFESVASDGLRLIRTSDGADERYELFDWGADAGERSDLAAERPEDVARLTRMLEERVAEAERVRDAHPPGEEAPPTDAEAREIEALGYAGDD